MEKLDLEKYFDEFIADLKNSSNMEAEEVTEEQRDESFFGLLPDELLTLSATGQGDTETSTSKDYNSQNPPASELPAQEPVPRSILLTPAEQELKLTPKITEEQSKRATRKFARILQKLGLPVRFQNFRIHSMLAVCQAFPICLERMRLYHHCSYEPEIFPALFYNVIPGATMTIFTSGKITLSGVKTAAEIYKAFEIVYPILSWFRR
ncbi:uncharacterized protein LOC132955905 [Labrus mixtus]|uniref:uncharacterized protein LOC132955905 n=1 Tax=Labrus mixtus TaxID=508554 RepID=UPI0029C00210|nr:uncharacterized protein LOC132955905 [Labrus mixtus]